MARKTRDDVRPPDKLLRVGEKLRREPDQVTWQDGSSHLKRGPSDTLPEEAQTARATFSKLWGGGWGIKVEGTKPEPGERVWVRCRSGKCKLEKVTRVISSFDDETHLCAIVKRQRFRR